MDPFDYRKTTLVADVLYGTIELTPLEKQLISTQAFNRLHNVLQNSAVYFTYPSNRTSRFSHSLGVVHIAGQMFRSGLLNANQKTRSDFIDFYKRYLKELPNGKEFTEIRKNIKGIETQHETQWQVESIQCPLYESLLIQGVHAEDAYTLIVVLQALRVVALLHDLGHLPFSHVAEFALTNIYERLKSEDTADKRNWNGVHVDATRKRLNKFLFNQGAFHELLGQQLAEALLNTLIQDLKETVVSRYLIFIIQVKILALEIFNASTEDHTPFGTMHDLVASDLDADRLDYVQRDMASSGLSREPFRPIRLLLSYTLVELTETSPAKQDGHASLAVGPAPEHDTFPRFAFMPSVRSINNLEDFYIQRLNLYKYVVFHHRVVKFDGLLRCCIESLADESLCKEDSVPKAGLLDSSIRGLWQPFDQGLLSRPGDIENIYIQWDDAWLLGILRSRYLEFIHQRKPEELASPLFKRLEELLSNKKHYTSLYKRPECFLDVDSAFSFEALKSGNLESWRERLRRRLNTSLIDSKVDGLVSQIKRRAELTANLPKSEVELTAQVEQGGYILSKLARIIQAFKKEPLLFVEQAARDLQNQYKISDIIVMEKSLRPGVTGEFLIADSNGAAIHLGRVSNVAAELNRKCEGFPPFFVFIMGNVAGPAEARRRLGTLLLTRFLEWLG